VTLDTTPDSTGSAAPTSGETAPEKPVRRSRRATAPAKAPAGTTEAAPAAEATAASSAVPAEEAPKKAVRRTPRKKAAEAPAEQAAPAAEASAPVAETPAPAADEAPKKPARRRATRPASSSAAVEAPVPAVPEPVAAPAAAPVVAESPAEPAPAEKAAPKRRRATRATAAATAPAAAEPVAAEVPAAQPAAFPVAAEPVAEAAAEAPTKPARRSRRATRPAASAEAPVAAAPAVEVEPVVDPVLDEEVEEELAVAPALDVLAELGAAKAAPAAQQPAAQQPAAQQQATAPEPQQRPGAGRLATTALLFQAPEARPRRRRASAPSGSPEAISAAAHVVEEEAVEVAAPAEQEAAPTSSRRSRGRRGSRSGRAAASQDERQDVRPDEQDGVEEVVEDEVVVDAELVDATDEVEAPEDAEQDEAGQDDEDGQGSPRRRRRRGGRGRRSRSGAEGSDGADAEDEGAAPADEAEGDQDEDGDDATAEGDETGGSSRRRRRRRRSGRGGDGEGEAPAPSRSRSGSRGSDEVTALRGSTRLEAKRQRRREGRDAGRRRQIITEAEFLARREAVERSMVVREANGKTQIAVLEDGVLVEHYVSRQAQVSMAGNVYLGRVQNVLPSMEAAFVDVGKGRNAVLYAGEVNWDAAGVEGGQPRRIEQALKSGDSVLVQVTKDPIGHKGARLTSQITLAGRYLVYVPGGGMTGISRKLPENERARLKKILREAVPDSAGVIVRTAAEGASEEELRADIVRLQNQWEAIEKKAKTASAPTLLQGEPDLAIRVVRDIFNDDFSSLVVQGDEAWSTISGYVGELAPDLAERVTRWTGVGDVFSAHRVDEQLAKGMDRKVWLPSGGSLVIDRTEAMTVVDVNTGKFVGAGGTLEETVTRNNLEAAEEIVRQLRLRDIGGIIVIDFIDMVLESNRDLVLRRLVECLGRDRTKHQVAEVTSLGLVQMTRKRVGQGLVEAFSETCEHCNGRGFIVHTDPVEKNARPDAGAPQQPAPEGESKRSRRKRGGAKEQGTPVAPAAAPVPVLPEAREAVKATLATIAAAAAHAHVHDDEAAPEGAAAVEPPAEAAVVEAPVDAAPAAEAPVVEEAPEPVAPALDLPEPAAVVEPKAKAPRRRATRARGAAEPVLDVLAALGDLAAPKADAAPPVVQEPEEPADLPEPRLALSPVDPGLFELTELSAPVAEDEQP
jgi:ribonuclease E